MPKPTKLHTKGKSTSIQKPFKVDNEPQDGVDPEESVRLFQLELCWCIQQLERSLSEKKGNDKQLQEVWKVLTVLKNNNQPMIRKRQLMRTHFGDYRAKMAAEERKLAKCGDTRVAWSRKRANKTIYLIEELSMLKAYNSTLQIDAWYLESTIIKGRYARTIFLMDDTSVNVIKDADYYLHSGLCCSCFEVLDIDGNVIAATSGMRYSDPADVNSWINKLRVLHRDISRPVNLVMSTLFGMSRANDAAGRVTEAVEESHVASKIKISDVPDKPKATFLRKSAFLTTGDESFRFNFNIAPDQIDNGNTADTGSTVASNDTKTETGVASTKICEDNSKKFKFSFTNSEFKFNFNLVNQ